MTAQHLSWLKRLGTVLMILAAGAVGAYTMDLALSLFSFRTQVVLAIVLALLCAAAVLWWTAGALLGAVDDIRATQDEIAEQRVEAAELLSYARELIEFARRVVPAETLPERAATALQVALTDTIPGEQLMTPQAVAGTDSSIEAWARAEVAKLWVAKSTAPAQDSEPALTAEPEKATP